jgi:mRNA-degrading endonuclease RelE of RelBE toxin-antitoxin system
VKLLFTKPFIRNYRDLLQRIQKLADKQLELLLADPRHPSLEIKKMQDPREIWEGRLTKSYRFTFQINGDIYVLRRISTHDLLKNP